MLGIQHYRVDRGSLRNRRLCPDVLLRTTARILRHCNILDRLHPFLWKSVTVSIYQDAFTLSYPRTLQHMLSTICKCELFPLRSRSAIKAVDNGCHGGLMDNAFRYVEVILCSHLILNLNPLSLTPVSGRTPRPYASQANGLCTEESYPYTSGTGVVGPVFWPSGYPIQFVSIALTLSHDIKSMLAVFVGWSNSVLSHLRSVMVLGYTRITPDPFVTPTHTT